MMPKWVQPTYKIIRILLYAFGAVLIYPYLPGEGASAFKGVTVFLGLLFSLGSTSAVANFVAGVILIYTRGFRKGNWVTIGNNTGAVAHQSMLARADDSERRDHDTEFGGARQLCDQLQPAGTGAGRRLAHFRDHWV
jgi:hypothetical protein